MRRLARWADRRHAGEEAASDRVKAARALVDVKPETLGQKNMR